MPRPLSGRVGRSAGVAEHRIARHRIARALSRTTTFTRATALVCAVAFALAGTPAVASARTSSTSLTSLRAAIDKTAAQWFAAQVRAAELDRQIQLLTKTLTDEEARVAGIRAIADRRAVQIYEDGTQGLGSMFGDDPLELGRRAALISQANTRSQQAIDALSSEVADLLARRKELARARGDLTKTLGDLGSRRRTLDTQLAALQLRSASAAERTVLAAEIVGRRGGRADVSTRSAPATAEPAPQPVASRSSAPAPAATTGAVSPHHDEQFLVCTRARESAGDYGIQSGNGYYGAYQFAPTTWNVASSHAGRLDLVGVLPSVASEYDQDEIAWSLYQWQGNAPWGGRC
jgi:Transglycosylase-like domain